MMTLDYGSTISHWNAHQVSWNVKMKYLFSLGMNANNFARMNHNPLMIYAIAWRILFIATFAFLYPEMEEYIIKCIILPMFLLKVKMNQWDFAVLNNSVLGQTSFSVTVLEKKHKDQIHFTRNTKKKKKWSFIFSLVSLANLFLHSKNTHYLGWNFPKPVRKVYGCPVKKKSMTNFTYINKWAVADL